MQLLRRRVQLTSPLSLRASASIRNRSVVSVS